MKSCRRFKSRKLNRRAYKLEKNIVRNITYLNNINRKIINKQKPVKESWETGMRIIGYLKHDLDFIGANKYNISNNRRFYYHQNLHDFKMIYSKFKRLTNKYYVENVLNKSRRDKMLSANTKAAVFDSLILATIYQKLNDEYGSKIKSTGNTLLPGKVILHLLIRDEDIEIYKYKDFIKHITKALSSIKVKAVPNIKKNVIDSTENTVRYDLIIKNLQLGVSHPDSKIVEYSRNVTKIVEENIELDKEQS